MTVTKPTTPGGRAPGLNGFGATKSREQKAAKPPRSAKTPRSARPPKPAATVLPEPPTRARRNPRWIALGVVALCLGALGSFFLYRDLSHAQTVVVVTQTVYRGSVVQSDDLGIATVGDTPGVRTVPADQLDSLVGQRATVDLAAGSLLPEGVVGPVTIPAAKRTLVGINLTTGRAPLGYLTPGSAVRLVAVPPEGAEPGFTDASSNLAVQARVVDSTSGADGGSVFVNVDVGADQAVVVATLAAQNRLVVVRDAER